jgi:hypothetical protein
METQERLLPCDAFYVLASTNIELQFANERVGVLLRDDPCDASFVLACTNLQMNV